MEDNDESAAVNFLREEPNVGYESTCSDRDASSVA